MINLIIKDMLLIKRNLWFVLLYSFFVFFLVNPRSMGIVYVTGMSLIGYMLLTYSTAYEDKNGSDALLNSLPVSRAEVVASKYVLVFAFSLLGLACVMLAGYVLSALSVLSVDFNVSVK